MEGNNVLFKSSTEQPASHRQGIATFINCAAPTVQAQWASVGAQEVEAMALPKQVICEVELEELEGRRRRVERRTNGAFGKIWDLG